MEAVELPTSVTVPRGVLAELNLVKAHMSRQAGRTVYHPEVITALIACWREQQEEEEEARRA